MEKWAQEKAEYVPPGLDKTCVVRLRLNHQDCDVYIGPHISNKYWQKNESKWNNPFHHCGDRTKGLQAYKQMILQDNDLMKSLRELKGKRLGCFCDDISTCHGSVLLELVQEHVPKRVNEILNDTKGLYFFKGADNPLSNLYECKIIFDDHEFKFLEQLRAYTMAKSISASFLIPQILKCCSSFEASKLVRLVARSPQNSRNKSKCSVWNPAQTVKNMVQLVEIKWRQVPAFRDRCLSRSNYIFLEATDASYWGAGIDIDQVNDRTELSDIPGQNLLGWIIRYVLCKNICNQLLRVPVE